MKSFSTLMGKQTLLPIIQADNVEQGLNIAKAMAAAGIGLVEVVLRTPASLDILKAIKQELPDLKVGAGTVLDANVLKQALDAGSDFIITPAISSQLLTDLAQCTVPVLPGVSNTADILLAKEFGYQELKLFPASLSGGAPFLKAMGSVFKGISFCPTGGVKQSNQDEYLALSNVFAVGGTWIAEPKWVELGQWSKITDACRTAQGLN
ncbi:bifunctional 4-hydroxy-2-oxoglutarate aldolase/2-dehydro-3-deoxy-phosphogluconate aldolase [Colwellia sp. MB02u-10]|uniref:bifunctional 4-hydroxy-2-oxoglutarate aldolase/2-dehydro-3-deoxy-phosphogluconate aldolase n=1 Tax=Colwellia sp. MB02u-10 TaxID=2759828 RepID=UPI0015F6E151|nr:bifunctional 4-hydroxy-2-oxoglutarate aldolase/2-dehydro-3-deoxy-phosphogluconate aldolase [Colwellia sp. MB02u-10]MBA6341549.1 bifunctional 4-hydroxy-2-oxoglutarate aldolase/2-dehydro-3-deoxy-phosphogluconate aldolase [Colwellia sp. MB02u-10]